MSGLDRVSEITTTASKDLCVRSRHVRHDATGEDVDVEREESRFPSTGRRVESDLKER
jgi:hypothetical protein